MAPKIRTLLRLVYLFPLIAYRKLISPLIPSRCIYYPSCSAFAYHAVLRFGIPKGSLLGLLRLLRCTGLFFTGGSDPVPAEFNRYALFGPYRRFVRRRKPPDTSDSSD